MSLSDQVALWGALLKHPAWQELEKMCDERTSGLASELLKPALNMEDTSRQNVNRGEIMGVHYMIGLPHTMWEEAQRALKQEKGVEDDEPEVDAPSVP